jgi:N-carbamoylputrescine amidase
MHLTIALLQMTAYGNDQTANQAKGEAFCRRAHAMGADIALFPEMWNIGFTPANPPPPGIPDLWQAPECWQMATAPVVAPSPSVLWQGQAISRDDPFITHFQSLARELQMAIALTYLEQWPEAPRNSMSLLDLHGKLVMTYAKVHTCDFSAMTVNFPKVPASSCSKEPRSSWYPTPATWTVIASLSFAHVPTKMWLDWR